MCQMKKNSLILFAGLAMAISSGAEEVSQSTVDVYVTAQGTDQKLAKTAELNLPQPSQKPDAVFVDSSKNISNDRRRGRRFDGRRFGDVL
jgi:hypothetical protein